MTSLECVPSPAEEILVSMCATNAMDIALKVAEVTQTEEADLRTGSIKCPNGEGFHSILTVNGKTAFIHLHWDTQQQAVDFARRIWRFVDKVLNSWHIHSLTGTMNVN